jgi:serine/threonine protein kinase
MRQVVEGIQYLHSYRIAHRDLTLANLLLTKDFNIVSITPAFLQPVGMFPVRLNNFGPMVLY